MTHSNGADLLTKREREVVRLFAKGLTYKEVAGVLKISSGVVKNHRHAVYKKLRINRAVTLARWAVKQGIA